jgi:cytidylate kinase
MYSVQAAQGISHKLRSLQKKQPGGHDSAVEGRKISVQVEKAPVTYYHTASSSERRQSLPPDLKEKLL